MRVGLVTPYSWTVPGGVNHHVEHLAAELQERGHETWIIAPVGAMTPTRRHIDSRRHTVTEHFIPVGNAVPVPTNGSVAYVNFSPQIVGRMDRAIRFSRFDVLHVHEPCTPMVSLIAVLMAASPVVGTFHAALESSGFYDQGRFAAAAVMKRLDVRVAVSEAARSFPQSRFPGPFRIIPNGVPIEMYAPAVGAAKTPGRILFVGRAEPRKGLGVLLHAFALLRKRMPNATLVVAGATRRQVLETERVGSDLPVDLTGVEALGWVDDEQKVAQLGQAQVLCAPSLAAESFGIVLAESMAAGVPVVASDLPGYRAVLRDGDAGRLSAPGDPVALADALYDLLQDEVEQRRLAAAGVAAAAELSWARITDRIVEAYEDAVAMPFVRGLHGLPGRPAFHKAILEYALLARRSGYAARSAEKGGGARPR
ncbi:MAG TPA: glycosyltransferase family 4 protein [Thermoleophilia bacterium]|nr:glycosyltransferase family 4 protein [Thermoleophilia bacterium]